MLAGLPTPLDPFEARRLLFTLLLLSVLADSKVVPAPPGAGDPTRDVTVRRATAGRRRHVRPPRSC